MELTASTIKTCSKCGKNLPIEMFGVHRQKKDGLRAWCKPCNQADARRWSKENPAKKAEARLEWKRSNPDRWKELQRKHQNRVRDVRLPRQRELAKRYMHGLSDNYVITALAMPRHLVTPELIELKRVNLQIHRLLKQQKEGK